MRTQVAAQQHQINLTEHYDTLLAREPSPPSDSNQNINQSLHRLSQALQAALLSLADHDPTESPSGDADINAEGGDFHQPPGARPPSKPREGQASSDAPLLQPQPGLAETPQPNTEASHSAQVESAPQAQPSPPEPSLSHDSAVDVVPATATATSDATTIAATTIASTPASPSRTGSRDPSPTTTRSETSDAQPDLDWSEVREHEIARLESENAHLRSLLGIDPSGLAAAGIPDIDPEPPFVTSSFYCAPHPPAAGSSAWANASSETTNPFTHGFREDPSVLGLAATPGRLHTLTPPNAPHAIMTTDTSTSATPNTAGGAPLTGRGAGVFVSASWGANPANGNGTGPGVGVGVGSGPVGFPQLQQQRSSPPPLGIAGLARMELQGPGVGGPSSGPGGAGRGRGVLFGGRGRSVGW